jgi:hypothetical protein
MYQCDQNGADHESLIGTDMIFLRVLLYNTDYEEISRHYTTYGRKDACDPRSSRNLHESLAIERLPTFEHQSSS